MTNNQTAQLLDDFTNDRIEPQTFSHAQHVEAAYALLRHKPFFEAAVAYIDGLKKLALAAGAPMKFNMTITLAYLGLIAERIEADQNTPWDKFIASNADLLDKKLLLRWYEPEVLGSDAARRSFVMPGAAAHSD